MNVPLICLVVALPAEAKALRHRYDLQREQGPTPFPLYRNREMALVLSGPGREAALEATTWLQKTVRSTGETLWINLGIAGHPHRPVGQTILAVSVEDQASGDRWDCTLPGKLPVETDRVITLDIPDLDHRQTGVVDMEAAGFYRAARAFTALDRIGCIKVISDNREHPADRINGKWVTNLIGEQIALLEAIVSCYRTEFAHE